MVDVKVDFGRELAFVTMKEGVSLDQAVAAKALPSGFGVASLEKLE